jgi:hypothetical protein
MNFLKLINFAYRNLNTVFFKRNLKKHFWNVSGLTLQLFVISNNDLFTNLLLAMIKVKWEVLMKRWYSPICKIIFSFKIIIQFYKYLSLFVQMVQILTTRTSLTNKKGILLNKLKIMNKCDPNFIVRVCI